MLNFKVDVSPFRGLFFSRSSLLWISWVQFEVASEDARLTVADPKPRGVWGCRFGNSGRLGCRKLECHSGGHEESAS